ncbi:hypothetical integral membrane protein DUF56 family [Plasmodium ovale curtisi]|uniref:Hypothetical integral membrane protein DUF56 family n=1 Tax=Plasmodium ovale curtisi TaxID=864141 RepID=A0A1A8WVF2_PLAOA|nr:hypothetical integral membrane protein DUF56 family [Plasmodium ovale curtisi]
MSAYHSCPERWSCSRSHSRPSFCFSFWLKLYGRVMCKKWICFIRFTDDRDRQGLVVTHIYLLAGVYIPIIIDVLFNNKNYVQTKGVFSYFFREANFNLYSSSLNAICCDRRAPVSNSQDEAHE